MPNRAYFPASEADRIVWLSNYQLKLPVQGAACGISVVKPHLDERPLLAANIPEQRQYRIRYWDKGQANGDYSPVQSVTVGV